MKIKRKEARDELSEFLISKGIDPRQGDVFKIIINLPSIFPILFIKSFLIFEPKEGAFSISVSGMSITSETASTSKPTSIFSSVYLTSTIMIHVRLDIFDLSLPILICKSIIGTTLPLRFITPSTEFGINGMVVIWEHSLISFTEWISTANVSVPERNVRN
jgi:hypothetical protein